MTINLKNTIVFSITLAALLNLWQFASSYQQREDALAPGWADAAATKASPVPSPVTPKLTPAPIAVVTPPPSVAPMPAVVPPSNNVLAIQAALASAGMKSGYADLYLAVEEKTGTPWQILAAVHEVESGQSGNTSRTSYAGAIGPMQFMPNTFYHYANSSDGDGSRDITNVTDAMYTAGRYLAAGGAGGGLYSQALYHYNHSYTYVDKVLGIADTLGL
ncbi:MAG TPA: lytic murein transglycosylase [Candidatus Saccharimonadia bacterium]|nr:lytic murein transglycosylase [Candidatus Saccharimonadia bacterium]